MADNSYLRFPHVSRNLLTFVAEDDVWVAPLDQAREGGARAWRATADRTPAVSPRLNPAGTQVAWSAAREGAREAYAVEVDGGPVRRLTYFGSPGHDVAGVRGWLSDTEVLVTGWSGHHQGMRVWPFAVPLDGPPRELTQFGPASDVSIAPDGAVLVGSVVYREPARWKRYRGGTGGKIWYSPDGAGYRRILGEVGGHLVNPMWVAGRVVFISDHEGAGAVYSALPDGSDVRRHTDHGPFYARHATTDGERVVYQCAGELWLLASLDEAPARLEAHLGGVRTGRAPYPVSANSELGSFSLCKTGRIVAAEVRGTAHWLPAEQGPARAVLSRPGVRARLPLILPGTSTVVCVSDADGEDGLDIVPAGGEPRRILSGELGRVLGLAASPDARTLAVAGDDGRLLTVDVESGAAREITRATEYEIRGLTFSPDSALLAWSQYFTPTQHGSHVRLVRLAGGEIVDVTDRRFLDHSPVFTKDGKYLAFLSNRTFDPVYDTQAFDLGFIPGTRPYLVTLAADTPSPFAPELDGRPAKPAAKDHAAKDQGRDGATQDPATDPVRLDVEGLTARVVPFPVAAGNYRHLRAADGAVLWLDMPRTGALGESLIGGHEHPKASLLSYNLGKRKLTTLVPALDDYAVSADGGRIAFRKDGELTVRPSGPGSDEDAISVDLDRIRVSVDPAAEWRQMYAENWRLMRDNFWREDMGGADWAGVRERYAPLLERIGSADDLRDVLWEAVSELDTSHSYVNAPHRGADPACSIGLLGADLAPGEDGAWRVARIVPGEPSVAAGRCPLEAPGVAARVGDEIVAVDGRPVDPARGPAALLVGKAEQPVELTLRREGAEDRQVVVVPLGDESVLRYHDLVRTRRRLVHELSGGRLGYLHVPDMAAGGWADLHRDLHTEMAREGLVFDMRENGGGHTSQLVLEKLNRKVIGWEMSRRSGPGSYPEDAPRGPMVALTDECAGSDGDIGTHVFRRYGLGPVVGVRTWGGVIGIDSRYSLVDGTAVTQPKYACWFDGVDFGIENHGVDPDVEVPIAPHDWAAGRDTQLLEGVRLALEALARNPAATPPAIPPIA